MAGGVRLKYRRDRQQMPSPPEDFFRALRRRAALRAGGQTDALRLLDGAGDGPAFDGLYLDDFAGRWLVQTSRPGQTPPAWLRPLADAGPDAPRAIYWKRLDSRGEHQQPPLPWAGEPAAVFNARENGLVYRIDFGGGYSQGLFLDQRDNRAELKRRVGADGAVLNCFAYTCAFSVAVAAAGARTVSVDLSRRSLDWGKENFRLNGIDPDADAGRGHQFLAGDVFECLRRFGRQGRRFRGVVLDPPTFSRDRKGRVFRVEDDFGDLVRLAAPLLEPEGWMLCSTNARGLTPEAFRRMIAGALPRGDGGRPWRMETPPLPLDFTSAHALQAVWCRAAPR